MGNNSNAVEINLNAVIVNLLDGRPCLLRLSGSDDVVGDILPSGRFLPDSHSSMEFGLRQLVQRQTGLSLDKCQQLYSKFQPGSDAVSVVTVGYVAYTRSDGDMNTALGQVGARWKDWYAFLPWENWLKGRPAMLDDIILPALNRWAAHEGAYATADEGTDARTRIRTAFGTKDTCWNLLRVVERFELMMEAGLFEESVRWGQHSKRLVPEPLGNTMADNNRHMLCVAIAQLRSQLKRIPVMHTLMPNEFTLTQLQNSVENILGTNLHKQNFRRMIDTEQLVEPTGTPSKATGGRPAALYRYRTSAIDEQLPHLYGAG